MSESSLASTQTYVQNALDRPQSFYLEWAQRPEVANALEKFKPEKEIRKTGRLDLVTWVQYICGFGYQGPTDEAWAGLFASCRVLPMLGTEQKFLEEHEIAVLLAYAKIKPDHGDTMTSAQLVKHRIKPAVLGRQVARTPGILSHIRLRFENWALGPFTDMFCTNCVSLFGPETFLPGIHSMPLDVTDVGNAIRQCADAHANNLMKKWGSVITHILDLEADGTGDRKVNFEAKLHEKRKYIYQHVFIKISEYWFNNSKPTSVVLQDRDVLHYRRRPAVAQHSGKDKVFVAKETSPQKAKLLDLVQKAVMRSSPRLHTPLCGSVEATLTICELHQPSRYGQAGLDFIRCEDVTTNLVKLVSADQISSFSPSRTNVRIGSFNAPNLSAPIYGVPPSQMCRALRLTLTVGVAPPKEGSDKPQFTITDINDASWVELSHEEDQCRKSARKTEDKLVDNDSTDENSDDKLNKWLWSSGIGKYLVGGEGCRWETFDLCEGMSKHSLKIRVPEYILERLNEKAKSGYSPSNVMYPGVPYGCDPQFKHYDDEYDTDDESGSQDVKPCPSKEFVEPVWIDCHAGARLTYIAPSGVELFAATPEKSSIFGKSPYWVTRIP